MKSEQPQTDPTEPRSLLWRYGTAVVAVGLATLIRMWLHPWLGDQFPTPTFFVAAMVTAWYAGFGPALLALALGGLSASYFFIPPAKQWGSTGASYLVGLSLYLFVG